MTHFGIILLLLTVLIMLSLPAWNNVNAATPTKTQTPRPDSTSAATAPALRPTPTTDPCKGAPKLKLKAGTQAIVAKATDEVLPGAFLKPEPSRLGPVLRYVPIGTVLDVVAGPRCSEDGGQWWSVKIGDLTGWMMETSEVDYILDPYAAPPAGTATPPPALPSTTQKLITCIKPSTPPTLPAPGTPVLRVVFATPDGAVAYSDNAGATRVIARFDPPPLSIDLSPDGAAALVVNYNGVYWVDLVGSRIVMVADATTFGLLELAWPRRATFSQDGRYAAVEIEDTRDDQTTFPLWGLPLDGTGLAYRADTGAQPRDSVRRAPNRQGLLMASAGEITPFPKNNLDEPDPLIEFVPQSDEGDARDIVPPAMTWALDGKGFYTYIPVSEFAGPNDRVGGRVWYIPLKGKPQEIGKPANVKATDYAIASPDGQTLLLGRGEKWALQSVKSGQVIKALEPVLGPNLFGWTPDGKGVIYTAKTGETKYLGIDGSTASAYLPKTDNLAGVDWLPDGTILFLVRGKDGKLSFSVQPPGKDPVFMGFLTSSNSFAGAVLPGNPGIPKPPETC